VRKIISILVGLSLLLSLSIMATPAAAAECAAVVTISNSCAGATATYCINFTSPRTVLAGNDLLSITFDEGTTFKTFAAGDIKVGGTNADVTKATVTGTKVEFPSPVGITAGQSVEICIAKVVNPAGGEWVLDIGFDPLCCGYEVMGCGDYTIKPAKSTYKFTLDFSPTYEGIAEDFVPPFQACGQCGYGTNSSGKWFTDFNITLETDVLGCSGYNPVIVNFELTEAPSTAAQVSLNLSDGTTWYSWVLTTKNATSGVGEWGPPLGFNLTANYTATTPGRIHFDTPGDYEICFELEYLGSEDVCSPIPEDVLVTRCEPIKVHQWKEAFKIPLYAKWNLVSLPFKPFDSDIDAMLESFPDADKIMAIWHYDQCADDWLGYPDQGLTDIVDGDAYWIRLPYNPPALNTSAGVWWVWGTDRPYEEAPVPFNYEVCEGWNMVGFTATWNMTACRHEALSATDQEYLWNWWDTYFSFADYSRIYGWDPATQTWDWQLPGSATLVPGEGYWIAFEQNGFIYP